MRIAVNTCFLPLTSPHEPEQYVASIFNKLVASHPQHQFVFIFNKQVPSYFVASENAFHLVISVSERRLFLLRRWYDYRLRLLLEKNKIDVLINAGCYCNLTASIPQLMVVPGLDMYFSRGLTNRGSYFHHYMPQFISKASTIVTVSEFEKLQVINHYHTDPKKIAVTGAGANAIFKSLTWQEREAVKEKYSNGTEYFLYAGPIGPHHQVITLLKAFSLFKKRQQSNMQLLLTGKMEWPKSEFEEKLSMYKYRDEVQVLNISEEELAKVTAAAYALLHPELQERFPLSIVNAMYCDVPVICARTESNSEAAAETAIYTEGTQPEDIAAQMKLIYKDETLRGNLIEHGSVQRGKYNWENAAVILWNCIENAVMHP